MEDREIVNLYWKRSETALAETEKKYGRYCHSIAYHILLDLRDAEETVNDTYLKTWNTLPPNNPNSLKSYVGMICRQLSFNKYEARHTQKRGGEMAAVLDELAECVGDGRNPDPADQMALTEALNGFLDSLSKETRRIFLQRYWYASSVKEIATNLGWNENRVSVLLFHTRKKLKDFLQKEGFEP